MTSGSATSDASIQSSAPAPPTFPPDVALERSLGVTFTQAALALTWGGAALDLLLNGVVATPIPYNYHAIAAVVHVTLAVVVLRRGYDLGIELMDELAELADRDRGPLAVDAGDVTGEEIRATFHDALERGFAPPVLLGGAVIVSLLVVAGGAALNLFGLIPYWIVGALFLAAHGLYLGPAVAAVYLITRSVRSYIVDIDVLAPDGVGGYRTIGDVIVSVATYAIVLLTLDFIVASAVSFVDRPRLQLLIGAAYVLWLLLVVALIVGGILAIRKRLLALRDAKVDLLRDRFTETERAYWQKQETGEDTSEEALDLMIKRSMFRELNEMSLWPINLLSLVKLGLSTGTSLFVFALNRGLVSLPL